MWTKLSSLGQEPTFKITGNGLAAGCQLFYRKIYGYIFAVCEVQLHTIYIAYYNRDLYTSVLQCREIKGISSVLHMLCNDSVVSHTDCAKRTEGLRNFIVECSSFRRS